MLKNILSLKGRARKKKLGGAKEGAFPCRMLLLLNIYKGGVFPCRDQDPCQPPLPPPLLSLPFLISDIYHISKIINIK